MTTTAPAAPPPTDDNMEDILTTIRNVIAGDGSEQPAQAEDILELTEIVKEGKAVSPATPTTAPSVEASPAQVSAAPEISKQEAPTAAATAAPISAASPVGVEPAVKAETPATSAPVAPSVSPPQAAPMAEVQQALPPVEPTPPSHAAMTPSIMSGDTAKTSTETIKAFADLVTAQHNGLKFRSGMTLEDIVIEALKPQLSEWLDKHLPSLVGRIVEREIQKLIPNED